MLPEQRAIVIKTAVEMVEEFQVMREVFPKFEWNSSGAVCVLSDGIAKAVSHAFGMDAVLDGPGVDLPGLNLEITAGLNISKSHRPKAGATFLWVRRFTKSFDDGFEVRIGDLEPEDFPIPPQGRHGSAVSRAVAMAKTISIYSTKEA